jgi:hypothetical protein
MLELRRLFARDAAPVLNTGVDLQDISVDELQDEYRACILEVFAKARLDKSSFGLEVHASAPLKDGRRVMTANVRLVKWDRITGLRLLVGLPMLERAVRRALAGSWASSSANFGGLWLHPSAQILDRALMKELARDLAILEDAGPYVHMHDSVPSGHSDLDRKATDWSAA